MAWDVFTRPSHPWRDIDVLISHEKPGGRRAFVTSFTMAVIEDFAPIPDEVWTQFRNVERGGGRAFLQAVLDAAWQAGLRPSAGVEEAGALKATEKHLEDMRRLVFEPDRIDVKER